MIDCLWSDQLAPPLYYDFGRSGMGLQNRLHTQNSCWGRGNECLDVHGFNKAGFSEPRKVFASLRKRGTQPLWPDMVLKR